MTHNYFIQSGKLLVVPNDPNETPGRLYDTYLCTVSI